MLGKLSPSLGTRPIAQITPHELLAVLKATERAGHLETARRQCSFSSRVFRYAVVTARATVDPAQPLQGALVALTAKHYAAIVDPIAFGGLLRTIDAYSGQPVTTLALRFTTHIFQRPGEARKAEWSEIDFDKVVSTIPATRLKQRQAHRVPLGLKPEGGFAAIGLARHGWATTVPARDIFKQAFARAGLPYLNPHSFRDMLVRHAMAMNLSLEAMKAWSQNLGHSDVLTTVTSNGSIPAHRQGDLIRAVIANDSGAGASREQIATLETLPAELGKGSSRG